MQTADIISVSSLADTKVKDTQKQNDYFSNFLSLNSTPKQPRIGEAVTGQAQIEQYSNKGIDKTSEKKAFISFLNNKALSFHGDVGKEGRQGDWYWQGRVEERGGTKEFFKNNENVDWIFKKGIGLLFMATQAWLDVLNAGVDSKFEGLPIGWLKFWESDIFLNFADLEAGQKFWMERGLDFSKTEAGEEFWISNGPKFSKAEVGKAFWKKHGLEFSKAEIGRRFLTDNRLKFLETEAGEGFLEGQETEKGASSTKKKIIIGGLPISLIAGSAVIGWRQLGPRGPGVPPPPPGGPRGLGVCRCGGLLGERAELEAERREEGGAVEEEEWEGIDEQEQVRYDESIRRVMDERPNLGMTM